VKAIQTALDLKAKCGFFVSIAARAKIHSSAVLAIVRNISSLGTLVWSIPVIPDLTGLAA
jgi:hypothetical protein